MALRTGLRVERVEHVEHGSHASGQCGRGAPMGGNWERAGPAPGADAGLFQEPDINPQPEGWPPGSPGKQVVTVTQPRFRGPSLTSPPPSPALPIFPAEMGSQ